MLKIDVLAELERAGQTYEYIDAHWLNVLCPFHDDAPTPSCHVNLGNQPGVLPHFKCHSCSAQGDFETFLSKLLKTEKWVIAADMLKRYGAGMSKADKPIETSVIEMYHERIWFAHPLLHELYKRGVTDEDIREFRLGEDRGRIKIPIKNEHHTFVNIIDYRPGVKDKKFTNMAGRGQPRIYPIDQLRYEKILCVGGPIKAIVAARELNREGIGVVTSTGGEQDKNWPSEFDQQICATGSTPRSFVGVCLDIDETGRHASQMLCKRFFLHASKVSCITLPLDKDKYPKGDINDYIGLEKKSLMPLIHTAEMWMPRGAEVEAETTPEPCTLGEAHDTKDVGKRIKFKGLIHAVEQQQFLVPKTVRVYCDRQQAMCIDCPMYTLGEEPLVQINKDRRELLALVGAEDKKHREIIRDALDIPACKVVDFDPKTYYATNEILITPPIDNYANEDNQVTLSAVAIDTDFSLNETYEITGRRFAHPKDQRSLVLVTDKSIVTDTLADYKIEPPILNKFRPDDWSVAGIEDKLKDIYDDMALNVTRIFSRQDLHLVIDLTYHSVLYFKPENSDQPQKGWVESLIVGDRSQGKSETLQNMMRHYGLGKRVESKGATAAGLLGGVQSMNGKHYITWGEIPAQDRRLCALEEIKGMPPEVMSRITDMRSSGWAEVPKIVRGKTRARTRLIMISNPRKDKSIDQHTYGVDAIKQLVGHDEDIRRFDIFQVISKDEIDQKVIHDATRANGTGEKKYDSNSCRALVLWAWTRSVDEVEFEDWDELLTLSEKLCATFSDDVSIVDTGSQRMKVARLSIALAARTFSTVPASGYAKLLVRRCHVQYIFELLNRLYTTKAFGYDRFTKDHKPFEAALDVDVVTRAIMNTQYPMAFVKMMLRENVVDIDDVCDILDIGRDAGKTIISQLVRGNALVRERGSRSNGVYSKTPPFIQHLRTVVDEGSLASDKLPDYLKPEM